MSDFTYQKPNENNYFEAIVKVLESRNVELASKIRNGKCTISDSSSFSQKRWNAYYTEVYINIPVEQIDNITDDDKRILLEVCDMIMPKDLGYDVLNIEVTPLLDSLSANTSLEEDLERISQNESYALIQNLPEDIRNKGQEMSEVYSYLYCIENTLRVFIEQIGKENHGDDYFNIFTISRSVRQKIAQRKEEETKNQWLCIRGDSDLFYLDFKELGDIIVNNWLVFKSYFPDQAFVSSKINELARCRNLVAHNSLVTSSERDLIRLYYNQFLSQINGVRHE